MFYRYAQCLQTCKKVGHTFAHNLCVVNDAACLCEQYGHGHDDTVVVVRLDRGTGEMRRGSMYDDFIFSDIK